jgi:hypothetical protein
LLVYNCNRLASIVGYDSCSGLWILVLTIILIKWTNFNNDSKVWRQFDRDLTLMDMVSKSEAVVMAGRRPSSLTALSAKL